MMKFIPETCRALKNQYLRFYFPIQDIHHDSS